MHTFSSRNGYTWLFSGSAWRAYKNGERTICGVTLPDGMKENQQLEKPIITPTTKAIVGHDEEISKEDIVARNIVSKEEYEQLEKYTHAVFQRGTEMAAKQGLILVDTKYEFGKYDGQIYLIDEIHTPIHLGIFMQMATKKIQPKSTSKTIIERVCTRMVDGK
ncbi:MAG: phosphoribosylaminoimidazolesuccinocarboxamide synthase [Chitinophagales bacterium]